MKIGVPKEIKTLEHRISIVPSGVRELTRAGHEVIVVSGAGGAIGFANLAYEAAGATMASGPKPVFDSA